MYVFFVVTAACATTAGHTPWCAPVLGGYLASWLCVRVRTTYHVYTHSRMCALWMCESVLCCVAYLPVCVCVYVCDNTARLLSSLYTRSHIHHSLSAGVVWRWLFLTLFATPGQSVFDRREVCIVPITLWHKTVACVYEFRCFFVVLALCSVDLLDSIYSFVCEIYIDRCTHRDLLISRCVYCLDAVFHRIFRRFLFSQNKKKNVGPICVDHSNAICEYNLPVNIWNILYNSRCIYGYILLAEWKESAIDHLIWNIYININITTNEIVEKSENSLHVPWIEPKVNYSSKNKIYKFSVNLPRHHWQQQNIHLETV